MRLSPQISISLLTPSTSDAEPTCLLLHDGGDTGLVLPGAILEAALELTSGWLVFLTHDVPFEEALEICLLSPTFELLDRATLAAPYSTGIFENLEIVSPAALRFSFLGSQPWQIDILDAPGFRLPLVSEPAAVRRAFGFSRRFRIQQSMFE